MDLADRFNAQDDRFAERDVDTSFMEGMAVHANDPAQHVSVLFAIYADIAGPHRSWHNVSVNLPDGRVAATIDFAPLKLGPPIESGGLRYEQIEPFSHWRYRFDAAVDYARQEDTLRHRRDQGERGHLSFEIDIKCATPAWSPPSTVFGSGADVGTPVNVFGFYVQNHRFSGWVQDDRGTRWNLAGTGWRHHVRSQPWGEAIMGHSFIHVLFPSGRAFGLQVAETTSGESTGYGYIVEGGVIHQAVVRSFGKWDRLMPRDERLAIVLEREDGQSAEIIGETLNNVATMNLSARPSAADLSDQNGLLTLFGDTRWVWDGETGYATWERTKLVRALRETN